MADVTVLYWRDIPAQVIVKAGRKTAKRELSARFQEAIDTAAMRGKAIGTDAYLEDWRRAKIDDTPDDVDVAADAAHRSIEHAYDDERLGGLIENRGYEAEACARSTAR